MSTSTFRINAPQVINEVMDGEAVIINLATGDYFSLRGSGAFVWSALEQGATDEAMIDALVASGMAPDDARSAVGALLAQLIAEGLIAPDDTVAPASVSLTPPAGPIDPPALEKFTDMQDLILLDPVHEVDERGWPSARSTP
ncbi:MAG: PqqD family protein [Microthrixaceae bacterium]